MAGSGIKPNLDSLIRNFSDDESEHFVIKISEQHVASTPADDEPDSDSSYERLAKANAMSMDQKILNEQRKKEEKTARINAAKLKRKKELDEQKDKTKGFKSFNNFKNSAQNKGTSKANDSFTSKGHSSKSEDYSNTYKNSAFKGTSYSRNDSPHSKNTSNMKCDSLNSNNVQNVDKKPKKNFTNKNKVNKVHIPGNREVNEISSKMKNVTIQNFDIESSPSVCSEEELEMNLEQYSKVLEGYQKGFTVRSLNRKEEVMSSSDDDQDTTVQDKCMLIPRFQSAEKSAASQRRKRSNYLRKRHSNFKNNSGDKEGENSKPKTQEQPVDCAKNTTKNIRKNVNANRNSTKIAEKTEDYSSDDSIKIEKVVILKDVEPTVKSNFKTNNSYKSTRKNTKNDKLISKDGEKNEGIVYCPDQKEDQNKNARDVKILKNKNAFTRKPDKSKINSDNIPKISKDPRSGSKGKPKNHCSKFNNAEEAPQCSTSINSIIAESDNITLKEENSEDEEVPKMFSRLDESQPIIEIPNLDNEIDWIATEKIQLNANAAKILGTGISDSESGEDVNFDTLIHNVTTVKQMVNAQKNNLLIEQDGSSSDFEAQFDASLVKFDRNK